MKYIQIRVICLNKHKKLWEKHQESCTVKHCHSELGYKKNRIKGSNHYFFPDHAFLFFNAYSEMWTWWNNYSPLRFHYNRVVLYATVIYRKEKRGSEHFEWRDLNKLCNLWKRDIYKGVWYMDVWDSIVQIIMFLPVTMKSESSLIKHLWYVKLIVYTVNAIDDKLFVVLYMLLNYRD